MSLGVLLALVLEVLKLINRPEGAKIALKTLKGVNEAFDELKAAKTPGEKQNAAEDISHLISGDGPSLK